MVHSLLFSTFLINQLYLFFADETDGIVFLLILAKNTELKSHFSILGLLLFKDLFHAHLKILKLVAANGLVVFKTHRIKFQQFAEVILDWLVGQLHLDLALEEQVGVVDWQLQFLIGISHWSKIKIIKLDKLFITIYYLLNFIRRTDLMKEEELLFEYERKKYIKSIKFEKFEEYAIYSKNRRK
jgi:hypothetical protein